MTRPTKRLALMACDAALAWIGLNLIVGGLVYILSMQSPEMCRLQWDDISQYEVLADVCKNDEVRAALSLADVADEMARK